MSEKRFAADLAAVLKQLPPAVRVAVLAAKPARPRRRTRLSRSRKTA